ncbi:type II toxin-antitoxin system RelE/ParE family toxin [Archangium lansingense]|uniref:Type II toxin-antitoxin system RelE/ParE family toxin n=1 Tax=Archangium lansingense TaxID=2995310 RepID=A0ABT3ZWS8_9BACT|nr:type II toxin-antitoxin system RelE/ParE family toxin [Archangium lansinium]MCY1073566.1 type II toxin-antitoxin system RelE/ParE family toxin [Archangium lansinium]
MPVEAYLDALDRHEALPIIKALSAIELYGLDETLIQTRALRDKLWELKLGRHRLFYVLDTGPTLVLLHACKKQSQKARKSDVDLAISRMRKVIAAASSRLP